MPLDHTVAEVYSVVYGVNCIQTYRFMQGISTLAERQALAQEVRNYIFPVCKPIQCTGLKYTAIVVKRVNDPNDSPYILAVNDTGSASFCGPPQVALQFNLLTGMNGRSGRGKWFVPGIHINVFVDGTIGSGTQSAINTPLAALKARMLPGGTGTWKLGVYSRKLNILQAVQDISYTTTPATLHSRRLGIGI